MKPASLILLQVVTSLSTTARFAAFKDYLAAQQSTMIAELEELDGAAVFGRDEWRRDDGSRGVTRVIQDGALIEKGCVSTSFVSGELTPQRAAAMSARGRRGVDAAGGQRFEAAALSLVIHPVSPHVPTLRGDARCFVVYDDAGAPVEAWYGGGCDLTPCYLVEADVVACRAVARRADRGDAAAPARIAGLVVSSSSIDR